MCACDRMFLLSLVIHSNNIYKRLTNHGVMRALYTLPRIPRGIPVFSNRCVFRVQDHPHLSHLPHPAEHGCFSFQKYEKQPPKTSMTACFHEANLSLANTTTHNPPKQAQQLIFGGYDSPWPPISVTTPENELSHSFSRDMLSFSSSYPLSLSSPSLLSLPSSPSLFLLFPF
jgi:hypothetical protein